MTQSRRDDTSVSRRRESLHRQTRTNNKKMKYINTLILTLLLSVSVVAQEKQNNFEIAKSLDIYNSLLRELNLNYVDEINPGELNETAIKAMLSGLDPYTVFIPESDIENAKFMTTGEYGGIGALIQYDGEYTRISDPYEGWPAQKSGLIAGDAIIEVNGVDCKKKNTQEVSNLLKGQPGTEVTLKIKRYGVEKPIEKTLKREKVKIDNIPYYKVFDNGVAYISLSGFTRDAGKEVKEKFMEMRKNHELKGFILDLRGNGGGLMNEAVDIVNLFVSKGKPVVSMRGKAACIRLPTSLSTLTFLWLFSLTATALRPVRLWREPCRTTTAQSSSGKGLLVKGWYRISCR